jgi:hypothetical protein
MLVCETERGQDVPDCDARMSEVNSNTRKLVLELTPVHQPHYAGSSVTSNSSIFWVMSRSKCAQEVACSQYVWSLSRWA